MTVSILHIAVLGIVSFVVTFVFVPVSKKLAMRFDAIDYPSSRRINTKPIPRLGGLALFFGLLVTIIFEVAGEYLFGWSGYYITEQGLNINHVILMIGLALIVFVGAIDDIFQINAIIKLAGQLVAAIVIIVSGVLLAEIKDPFGDGFLELGLLAYPVTIIYLVAFANIMNLIDGMDGLASGIVGIASLALVIIAFGRMQVETAVFGVIIFGACLAFLRYNFPPASIFMGDSGSLFLGMILGVMSLMGVMRSPTFIVLIVPMVIAGVPILDTAAAIIRRLLRRQPIQQPDKEHLHHKMLSKGLSLRASLLIIYAWSTMLAICGVMLSNMSGVLMAIVFIVLALVSAMILWFLGLYDPILRHYRNPRKK